MLQPNPGCIYIEVYLNKLLLSYFIPTGTTVIIIKRKKIQLVYVQAYLIYLYICIYTFNTEHLSIIIIIIIFKSNIYTKTK